VCAFPLAYRDYFQQTFAGRQSLVRLHALVTVNLLHVPSTHKTLLGSDNWLFFNGIDYYKRNAPPLTPDELNAWQHVFDTRNNWLAKRGIHYLVVFVPEKYTIYPEYMPAEERPAYKVSRLEQLLAHMRDSSSVPMLDLRPALLAHKAQGILFRKTDAHWNDLGGFFAYQAIMNRLQQWYPHAQPSALSDYSIGQMPFTEGEAATEMGLPYQYEEQVPQLLAVHPKHVHTLERNSAGYPDTRVIKDVIITECRHAEIPKVVILRDSFCYMLTPFLSQHFGRAVYLWEFGFNPQVIEQEHPDLVIQERVERVLLAPPLPAGIPQESE